MAEKTFQSALLGVKTARILLTTNAGKFQSTLPWGAGNSKRLIARPLCK